MCVREKERETDRQTAQLSKTRNRRLSLEEYIMYLTLLAAETSHSFSVFVFTSSANEKARLREIILC